MNLTHFAARHRFQFGVKSPAHDDEVRSRRLQSPTCVPQHQCTCCVHSLFPARQVGSSRLGNVSTLITTLLPIFRQLLVLIFQVGQKKKKKEFESLCETLWKCQNQYTLTSQTEDWNQGVSIRNCLGFEVHTYTFREIAPAHSHPSAGSGSTSNRSFFRNINHDKVNVTLSLFHILFKVIFILCDK